jgi:hypothetical protein
MKNGKQNRLMGKLKRFLHCLVVFLSIGYTGCGSDSTGSPKAEGVPRVEYTQNVSAPADLEKYTNADWLYQNYFGEYGLPDELKGEMAPELQRLANGFALQHALGEDVGSSIAQFHSTMQMLYVSGQLGSSLQSIVNEHNHRMNKPTENPSEPDSGFRVEGHSLVETAPGALSMLSTPAPELELDEEARKNVEEAKRLDEEDRMEQERMVVEHNLPYPLPGKELKYIIYDQAMKRRRNRNPPPAPAPQPKSHLIEQWEWQNADIVWTNGGAGLGHMGLVAHKDDPTTRDGSHDVIDANTPGVKRHFKLDEWARIGGWSRIEGLRYSHPAIVTTSLGIGCTWWHGTLNRTCNGYGPIYKYTACPVKGWDAAAKERIVQYANNLVGNPYNWVFFDKNVETRTYCSQLVWQAYKVGTNNLIDLDSDAGLIVYPGDIKRHWDMRPFNSSQL